MIGSNTKLSAEVLALLDKERDIPALSSQVRARSIARARAALVAGRVTPPAGFDKPARGGHSGLVKVTAACVVSAAIGAAAFQMATHRGPAESNRPVPMTAAPPVAPPASPSVPAVSVPSLPSAPEPAVAVTPSPALPALTPPQRASHGAARPDELRLLRQARAAVAQREFGTALARIEEHTRRYRESRLVEEREALRVKTLAGLGRTQEAQHAADAFAARFPRSVLLSAIRQMTGSPP